MKKIKNWFVTILLIVGAIADLGFDTLTQIGLDQKSIAIIRAVAVVIGAVVLKLQNPSTNPSKLYDRADRVEEKQNQNKK